MRICVIEAANFCAAIDRLDQGIPESYQGQRYSTDFIRSLSHRADSVTLIGTRAALMPVKRRGNMTFHAFDYWAQGGSARLTQALDEAKPTHILLRLPLKEALDYANAGGIDIAVMLADSFSIQGWGPRAINRRLKYRALGRALNHENVALVGNHNRSASRDLLRIGVAKNKTLPWEWPTPRTPDQFSAKTRDENSDIELLYAGAMVRAKGVYDILDAIITSPLLQKHARLTMIGKGETDSIAAYAANAGIGDKIQWLGTIPNAEVFTKMRDADIVLVPSHHAYAEGLPKTIREALTVRTPVVMSDHPMFKGYFREIAGYRMVKEQSPQEIAAAIEDLVSSISVYEEQSAATAARFADIDCPHKWADVIDHWLRGDPEDYLATNLGRWE